MLFLGFCVVLCFIKEFTDISQVSSETLKSVALFVLLFMKSLC